MTLSLVWRSSTRAAGRRRSLIGIGLDIAGALDRSSKKTFPVLGLVLNFGILAISAAVIAIGLRMGLAAFMEQDLRSGIMA
jgi:hypothetical protein